MWRNKAFAAVLLSAAVMTAAAPAVSAGSGLIAPEDIKADTVNYTAYRAEYGELQKFRSCSAVEYEPVSTRVLYQGESGTFIRFAADKGDTVKAGDVIAEVQADLDEVTVAEKELKLQRLREQFAEGTAAREKAVAEKTEARDSAADSTDYQKETIRIRMLEVELEQYVWQQESAIAALEEELAELYARREPCLILAPCDGEIESLSRYSEGDEVKTGDVICTVRDPSVRMVKCVDNSMAYGLKVTVSGRSEDNGSMSGRVVISSSVIPGSTSQFALVELGDPETYTGKWVSLTAKADLLYFSNVLLIPNSCRSSENNSYYVTVLDGDSIPHRRKILTFLNSQSETWVLDGIREGDLLVAE